MPDLKLAKLPERIPVKLTVTLPPDLAQALCEYAAVYRVTYGQAEAVEELVPFMLASFIEADRGFAAARKDVTDLVVPEIQPRRRGRRRGSASASTGVAERA